MDEALGGWLGLLSAAFLGLCVGSFANAAIWRIPLPHLSVLRPRRSMCPSCGTQLGWRENIPVLSWVALRGRCRSCDVPISWRYPLVELLVGALFVVFWWLAPPVDLGSTVELLVAFYLVSTCVIVSGIDLDHTIIPDVITLPSIVLGVALAAAFPVLHAEHALFRPENPHGSAVITSLAGMLAGGGLLWLVGLAGNVMLRKQVEAAGIEDAMGLGDVKWMAAMGTFLGPLLVLDAIMVACVGGALVGVLLRIVARVRQDVAPPGLPFGPFLSAGVLVEMISPAAAWEAFRQIGPAA